MRPDVDPARAVTILVLEPYPGVRDILTRILGRAGYRVLGAGSREQAEQVCAGHSGVIDLILAEVDFPPTGGVRAALAVTGRHPGAAVLYCSGHSRQLLVRVGALPPDVPFLAKPFLVGDLLADVREVLWWRPQ